MSGNESSHEENNTKTIAVGTERTGKSQYRERCLREKEEECVKCGTREGIVVHHLDGDRSNNELENLIPVCWSCHQKVHRCTEGYEDLYEHLEEPSYGPSCEAAFSAEEAEKTTVYGRKETLRRFRAALAIAKGTAMLKYNLDNIKERELHEAALRVGARNIDEVAEKVAEERIE